MRCLRSLPCRRHQALTWRESPSPWWPVQPSASQYGSREPPPVRPRRQNPCGPKTAGWPSQTAGHTPSPKWDTGHTAKRPRAKALLAGRTTRRVRQRWGTAGAHRSTAKSHSRTDSQNNIWTKPGPLRYDWEKSISFDFWRNDAVTIFKAVVCCPRICLSRKTLWIPQPAFLFHYLLIPTSLPRPWNVFLWNFASPLPWKCQGFAVWSFVAQEIIFIWGRRAESVTALMLMGLNME